MHVWAVFIDQDMTMRSKPELDNIFASQELAENYLDSLKAKYSEAWHPTCNIRRIRVISNIGETV